MPWKISELRINASSMTSTSDIARRHYVVTLESGTTGGHGHRPRLPVSNQVKVNKLFDVWRINTFFVFKTQINVVKRATKKRVLIKCEKL